MKTRPKLATGTVCALAVALTALECGSNDAGSNPGSGTGGSAGTRDAGIGGSSGAAGSATTGGSSGTLTGGSSGAAPGGASGSAGSAGTTGSDGAGGSGATGPADFATRCAAPGVVRCVGFDTQADIAGGSGDPTGSLASSAGIAAPALDTTVKASGNSSLKFTIPSNSPADTSGSYFANFSDDLSVQFDSGQEFFVQWRQRFAADFLTTQFAGGEGWKQVIIGEGSRPNDPVYSCTTLEVVVVNSYHRGFPEMYHSCGVKDGQYEGLEPPIPPDDFALENAISGCTYHNPTVPPCFGYKPDQWMTFQVHVKIGTWYKNDGVYLHDSTVQLWVAEEGKPSTLVIDMSPGDPACAAQQTSLPACHTGYDLVNDAIGTAKYGQVWLLPYNTGKDSSVSYPETYTWYDELIVSSNRIADPAP